ncbi:MAG: hypothetical protein JNK93_12670 [Planctomycetia bacterium]|nr:hypothetical protein [Planctomycetia bacterium]
MMYEDGVGIVAVGRVLEYWDGITHRTTLYYQPGSLREYRIKVRWRSIANAPISVATIKEELGYQPRGAVRRIVKSRDVVERWIASYVPANPEVAEEETYLEGEVRSRKSAVRNPQLRADAKRKWGVKCHCCGFDFETFYGDGAKGVAIVHHLEQFQLSNGKPREATLQNVRVVCANCHLVIHLEKQPIHVDDLKKRISESWTMWTESGVRRKKEFSSKQ